MSLDPNVAPRPKKEMPVWGGVVVGLVVACAVVGVVVRLRTKGHVEPRAATSAPEAAMTGAPQAREAAGAAQAAVAATGAPQGSATPVDRVVVYPVMHPADTTDAGATTEREAVDALHSGDLRRAAEIYGKLAADNPDNPALVDAARLLGASPRGR